MNDKYVVIGICGEAGSGKTYLANRLRKTDIGKTLNWIVSDTTRPPRPSEKDGEAYNFLSEEKFDSIKHIEQTSYEVAPKVFWKYGTPVSALTREKINIGIFNPEGLDTLSSLESVRLYVFYIHANPPVRMIRQLLREEKPNCSEICRRFLTDEKDFSTIYKYYPLYIRNNADDYGFTAIQDLRLEIEKIQADLVKMK